MNREIKFRAFYPAIKKMEYEPEDGFRDDASINDRLAELNSYELMQFTGLIDKHGTEIYEGDIVIYWMISGYAYSYAVKNSTRKVEWNDQIAGWNIEKSRSGESRWEVIGNVWEHPELLEGKS